MTLQEVFVGSQVQLESVTYHNKLPIDTKTQINLICKDTLGDIQLKNKKSLVLKYQRKVFSEQPGLEAEVVFSFSAKLQENVDLSEAELEGIIRNNIDAFLGFTIPDASLMISNIFKTAGFTPYISQPVFIEEE